MKHHSPPKAPIDVGAAKFDSLTKIAFSGLAGVLSYYVFHKLSGFLGEWAWPPFLTSISRLYKPITMPATDLLVLGTPMVLAYLVTAFVWFPAVRTHARGALVAFALGWLVPTLLVIAYGEHKEPGVFLRLWAEWPHTAILHFCPLVGMSLGFRLSRRRSWSTSGAT